MSDRYRRLRNRRVLVTGATGFLGQAVVRELHANDVDVIALVRDRTTDVARGEFRHTPRAQVIRGRVEDSFRMYSALAVHEVASVFHLAACHPLQPDRGTANLLEAVHRYDRRIPVVMARPTVASPMPGSPTVLGVARFGELYGGGDRNIARVVPATLMGLLTGDRNSPALDQRRRDFVFVNDAARACVALADALMTCSAPTLQEYEFQSGVCLTDREMALAIRDVHEGRDPQVHPATVPPQPLGWIPGVSLRDGLTTTMAWYRDFLRNRFFGTKPAASPYRAAA